jgi:predicted MFS family arabinose efflux permease
MRGGLAVARRTLVILLLVFAVSYMDRQLLAILIEPIKRDLGMSDSAAGLLYGFTFVVFYSTLGIPIARLADRSKRTLIITASLALFSAMTAATAWAGTYVQLLLARIGVGIGEAGTNPASHSMIADLYPVERRSTAMGVFALGPHVGLLLGFPVGGFLGQLLGWRTVFLIAGAAGLAMAAVASLVLEEPTRAHARDGTEHRISSFDAVRTLWRSRALRHLFCGGTIANIAVSALLAWLPAFLMRSHGMSLSAAGVLLALVLGVLGGGGTLLGGWLADRLGTDKPAWRMRSIALVLVIVAACWTIAFAVTEKGVALLALAIAGGLIGFNIGPSFAMVQSLAPADMRAFAAALLLFAVNLVGLGIGPLAVGLISDAWTTQYGSDSLRSGLMIAPPLLLWGALHYEAAARHIATELHAAAAPSARLAAVERAKT